MLNLDGQVDSYSTFTAVNILAFRISLSLSLSLSTGEGSSVLAPPPGFAATHQKRDIPAATTSTTPTPTSSGAALPVSSVGGVSGYSLWGSSPGVQGLFQQAQGEHRSWSSA